MEPATTRISPHEMQMIQGGSRPVRAWAEAKVFRGVGSVSQGVAFDSAIPRRTLDAASVMVQPRAKPFRHLGGIRADSTFPDDSNPPSGGSQRLHVVGIPFLIPAQFAVPEGSPGLREAKDGQPSCLCQKQPCTKITARRLAKTMSGSAGL